MDNREMWWYENKEEHQKKEDEMELAVLKEKQGRRRRENKKYKHLIAAGYHVEIREYYHPSGEIYDDAVIYPNGDFHTVSPKKDDLRNLSLKEQWKLAQKHYERNRSS